MQISQPWTCVAVGDGSPYDLEVVEARSRLLGNVNPSRDGVIYWNSATVFPDLVNPTNEFLRPEFVSGNTVRINPGIGMVQGWIFFNDADVDFNVVGGNANAVDIIGLRRDLAGQTVRLFHGRGAAGNTYNLVQTTATWEIPLMYVTLNGAGNYSSFTDGRTLVKSPMNDRVLLSERIITAAEAAALTTNVTFSNLNLNAPLFKDLVLEMSLRSQGASFTQLFALTIGGLSGNIFGQIITDAAVTSNGDTGSASLLGQAAANGTDSWPNLYSRHVLTIFNAGRTGITKEFRFHEQTVQTFAGRAHRTIDTYGNKGNSTSIPSSLSITTTGTTWLAGSTFRVYGVH